MDNTEECFSALSPAVPTVETRLQKRACLCDIWEADPPCHCCCHVLSFLKALVKGKEGKGKGGRREEKEEKGRGRKGREGKGELVVEAEDVIIKTSSEISDEHESYFCDEFSGRCKCRRFYVSQDGAVINAETSV